MVDLLDVALWQIASENLSVKSERYSADGQLRSVSLGRKPKNALMA
jgi:hypothetical protein